MVSWELMNLNLQRRTDLSLAALRTLATTTRQMSGAELADAVGTTVTYLPQVMAPLIQAGWVTSERGPGGGYRLVVDATDLRLLDVIELTEGSSGDRRCALRDSPCPGAEPCQVHSVWTEARQVLIDGLGAIPLLEGNPREGER